MKSLGADKRVIEGKAAALQLIRTVPDPAEPDKHTLWPLSLPTSTLQHEKTAKLQQLRYGTHHFFR